MPQEVISSLSEKEFKPTDNHVIGVLQKDLKHKTETRQIDRMTI